MGRSDNPHEANFPLKDQPQTHANFSRKHDLRRHTTSPTSPETVLLSVILPRHFIASACALRSPFCRLTPYRCLGGLNNLNSLRRIDPTIASSSSSATFVYTDFTKKRMVSRAHLFSLSGWTKDPLSESTFPCSQFQISRSYVSSRKRKISCGRKMLMYGSYPEFTTTRFAMVKAGQGSA